ncbi:cation diffusion facilitator family transporter [Mycoplasma sp. P36-A1]|uniref:cation diffusion facilitator family transporter n=1 Tax=Mycoplasma sp. P36-A1 TaxID=3252900 RepID=UPI003C2E0084
MKEKNAPSGMFAVIIALAANVLVAISKFIGFLLSGSTAMMNESIHSFIDCSNQILLLVGNKKATTGQSELHQFGEARAKYFYSTIVAMMLFFGGGALGVYEAIEKLLHPSHEISNIYLIIGILIFGLIVEGSSLRVAFKEIKELNIDKLPLFKFLKESRHSEILVIFAEDTCAVVGLLLALLGTTLTLVTNNAMFDALSGLLIGLLLMGVSIVLAREFYSLMIGESVTKTDLKTIMLSFNRKDVDRVIDIKTVHLGPTEILVAAKIDLVDKYNYLAHDIINDIEKEIRSTMPDKKIYIYIETDQYDPDYDKKKLNESNK